MQITSNYEVSPCIINPMRPHCAIGIWWFRNSHRGTTHSQHVLTNMLHTHHLANMPTIGGCCAYVCESTITIASHLIWSDISV